MNLLIKTLAALAACTVFATGAFAQSTVVPIDNEPAPRLIVEPPLPGPLARASCSSRTGWRTCASCLWAGRPQATCLRGSGTCTSPSTTCLGRGRTTVRATPSSWWACRAASIKVLIEAVDPEGKVLPSKQ